MNPECIGQSIFGGRVYSGDAVAEHSILPHAIAQLSVTSAGVPAVSTTIDPFTPALVVGTQRPGTAGFGSYGRRRLSGFGASPDGLGAASPAFGAYVPTESENAAMLGAASAFIECCGAPPGVACHCSDSDPPFRTIVGAFKSLSPELRAQMRRDAATEKVTDSVEGKKLMLHALDVAEAELAQPGSSNASASSNVPLYILGAGAVALLFVGALSLSRKG